MAQEPATTTTGTPAAPATVPASAIPPSNLRAPIGPYRAVCIDLDGTLLPMELDEFLQRYYAALEDMAQEVGASLENFTTGLNEGVRAMMTHDDDHTNAEVFWEHFFANVDQVAFDWTGIFSRFYEEQFNAIGADIKANPAAAKAIQTLQAKGYPVVLTTMPLFPLQAVAWRLDWAGVDREAFARITTYDNSTAAKPKAVYFAENLAAMGVCGADVLMVGNNTEEDLAFCRLGADEFLVTDFLLNPADVDLTDVRHGTLEEFATWAESLPVCANPATQIGKEVINREVTEEVLVVNERMVLAAEKALEDQQAGQGQ